MKQTSDKPEQAMSEIITEAQPASNLFQGAMIIILRQIESFYKILNT